MNFINLSIEIIKEGFPNVVGIWLFGSVAAQTASANSDIDLAVLLPQKANSIELWKCAQKIASKLGKEVDLIDLLEASTVLRSQIMQEGSNIFCADKFKCDLFETESLTDYLRFSEERKEVLEAIKSRGTVLGDG